MLGLHEIVLVLCNLHDCVVSCCVRKLACVSMRGFGYAVVSSGDDGCKLWCKKYCTIVSCKAPCSLNKHNKHNKQNKHKYRPHYILYTILYYSIL